MTQPLDRIEALERQMAVEPGDDALKLEWIVARSRIEGETVLLELLDDRLFWNAVPEAVQDQCIAALGRLLGEPYEFKETKLYQCQDQAHRIATFEHKKTGLRLNLIPGGSYLMGTKDIEAEYKYCRRFDSTWPRLWNTWEQPQHSTAVAPFLIGAAPVHQRAWDIIGGEDQRSWQDPMNPIESASWTNINNWFAKAKSGLRFASEAEWEYAARSGTTTRFFWGTEMDDDYCWYTTNSQQRTQSIALHKDHCNAFGLSDVHGLVWEWCEDHYVDFYNDGPYDQEPRYSAGSRPRVIRGGYWGNKAGYCRITYRYGRNSQEIHNYLGFRVALTIPSKDS